MPKPPFRGTLPADRLYDPRHDMWVQENAGEVLIGATAFGIHLAGEIIAFTAKPCGAEIGTGRGLGTVECAKTVLAVHAPVAFHLTAANEAAEDRPDLINRDPHGNGWMARGTARDWPRDRAHLVDAATYRRHILAQEPDAKLT